MKPWTNPFAARREKMAARAHRELARVRRMALGPHSTEEEVWLTTPEGYRIHAHLHRPSGRSGPFPAMVLVPGKNGTGGTFDTRAYPVSAEELAALGVLSLHFDPTGLGRSWGQEDSGGPAQQASLLAALEFVSGHADVARDRIGVLAISLGIAMTVPVVAREGGRLGVRLLVDWEGPCDRTVITSWGRILSPALGHSLADDTFWFPREAVRHVGGLRCGYVRMQSSVDHAQGHFTRHAVAMVNAAVQGGCPDARLNDQPPGTTYDADTLDPRCLLAPGERAAHQFVMRVVRERLMG